MNTQRAAQRDSITSEFESDAAAVAPADPRDFIRDPYVLEFLGARARCTMSLQRR
jgi:predicted nuclease of restriction endonuclease-like (RecB) superfamily